MFVNRYGVLMAGAKLERKRGPLTVLRGEQVQPDEPKSRQFEYVQREGEELTLEEAVFQALGAASTAWTETPKGVFESTYARSIGDRLVSDIRNGNLAGFVPAVEPSVHVELSPVLQMTLRGLADDYGPLGIMMCCEKMWPGTFRVAHARSQRPEGQPIDPKEAP